MQKVPSLRAKGDIQGVGWHDAERHHPYRFVEEENRVAFYRGDIKVAKLFGCSSARPFTLTVDNEVRHCRVRHVDRLVWTPRAALELLGGASIQGLLGRKIAIPRASIIALHAPNPGLEDVDLLEVDELCDADALQRLATTARAQLSVAMAC